MSAMQRVRTFSIAIRFAAASCVLFLALVARAQQPPAPIPTIDADAGECSVEFTVLDPHGKPVPDAVIRLTADYGFMGLSDLDLSLRTNAKGRGRFDGLPDKTDGVLYFAASSGEMKGVAVANPQSSCQIHHAIILAPPSRTITATGERQ